MEALNEAIQVEATEGQKAHTWLTQSEVKRLLDSCNLATVQGKRDKVILGLLVGAGLRREELVGLTFDAVINSGRDCLCKSTSRLNKYVRRLKLIPEQSLDIIFEDGSQISISLRPTDYVGAEALEMSARDKQLIIIWTDTEIGS